MTTPIPAPAFQRESRRTNLARLAEEELDVLILGGGINGAGVARDLALRARRCGMRVRTGLVEQRHFASGASGRNSQLIHGGLRYLKQFQFGLVREALRERATLLEMAPHLVEPLPLLIPMYGRLAGRYYGAGLWLYDLLAGKRNIERRRYLSPAEVAEQEPSLSRRGLSAAAIYHDCRVNSARMVLDNIFDAAREGVIIANYARALEVTRQRPGFRVQVEDMLAGGRFPVRAHRVVDARGPWEGGDSLRRVRGSHLVYPRLSSGARAIAHFGKDGRIIFVIPWGPDNQLSLVGTTDVDHDGSPDSVHVSRQEVGYLEEVLKSLFPRQASLRLLAAYASLRPLLQSGKASPTSASREHRIGYSADGVLHIAGGKFTTYRAMSQEAVDKLWPELEGSCRTAQTPLGGNSRQEFETLLGDTPALAARHGLELNQVRQLVRLYGVQAPAVLGRLPDDAPPGLARSEAAIIAHAIHHEMAERLADLVFVSTYWGFERPCDRRWLMPVARETARHLDWIEERIENEVALVERICAMPVWPAKP